MSDRYTERSHGPLSPATTQVSTLLRECGERTVAKYVGGDIDACFVPESTDERIDFIVRHRLSFVGSLELKE